MTDLRTRIAAAIYGVQLPWDGHPWQSLTREAQSLYLEQADAVIRELGLQPNLAKRIINGKPDQWVRRYVTDWEIVDD